MIFFSRSTKSDFFRVAAMVSIALLVEMNIVVGLVVVTWWSLFNAGVPFIDAARAAMWSPFLSVPVLGFLNAVLIFRAGRPRRRDALRGFPMHPAILGPAAAPAHHQTPAVC